MAQAAPTYVAPRAVWRPALSAWVGTATQRTPYLAEPRTRRPLEHGAFREACRVGSNIFSMHVGEDPANVERVGETVRKRREDVVEERMKWMERCGRRWMNLPPGLPMSQPVRCDPERGGCEGDVAW